MMPRIYQEKRGGSCRSKRLVRCCLAVLLQLSIPACTTVATIPSEPYPSPQWTEGYISHETLVPTIEYTHEVLPTEESSTEDIPRINELINTFISQDLDGTGREVVQAGSISLFVDQDYILSSETYFDLDKGEQFSRTESDIKFSILADGENMFALELVNGAAAILSPYPEGGYEACVSNLNEYSLVPLSLPTADQDYFCILTNAMHISLLHIDYVSLDDTQGMLRLTFVTWSEIVDIEDNQIPQPTIQSPAILDAGMAGMILGEAFPFMRAYTDLDHGLHGIEEAAEMRLVPGEDQGAVSIELLGGTSYFRIESEDGILPNCSTLEISPVSSPIHVDEELIGSEFCVYTNEARWSWVRVVDVRFEDQIWDIHLSFVTWE